MSTHTHSILGVTHYLVLYSLKRSCRWGRLTLDQLRTLKEKQKETHLKGVILTTPTAFSGYQKET